MLVMFLRKCPLIEHKVYLLRHYRLSAKLLYVKPMSTVQIKGPCVQLKTEFRYTRIEPV